MRLPLALLISVVATVTAYLPLPADLRGASGTEGWSRGDGGSPERRGDLPGIHSIKLKRTAYPDDGTHPEIRGVRAANYATHRYRRRGIPGPAPNAAAAIHQVEESLQRRGLLPHPKREIIDRNGVATSKPTTTRSRTATGTRSPASITRLPIPTPQTEDSLGVGQDGEDLVYFTEINFGTNNKTFVLLIDTGSSDTWIPSDSCTDSACKVHSGYGEGDSDAFVNTNRPWDIRYGTGEAAGFIVSDIVSFAGFRMNASFGLATELSDDFAIHPIDGILGLGFFEASQQQVPTIMDELVDEKLISRKLFGVALSRNVDGVDDGVLNLGAVDPALYDGNISFSPSVSSYGLWELEVDSATVDGEPIASSARTAIIDTGTSLLLLPPADAIAIHNMIPDADTNGELFSIPCDTAVNITFGFGGVTYTVPPADYVGSPVYIGSPYCISYIMARQIIDKSTWLFGDVFLRNVYSVYDMENNRVGFAPRKEKTGSSTAAATSTRPPSGTSARGGSTATPTTTGTSDSGSDVESGASGMRAPPALLGGRRGGFEWLPSRALMVLFTPCLVSVAVAALL